MLPSGTTDSVFEALVDPLFVLDLEGRLLHWNEQTRHATGYADDELRGMPALDLFDAAEVPRVAEAIETALREGRVFVEVDVKRRDGARVPFELSGSVLHDEAGEVVGLCGVGRDLTERKRMERRLRQSEHDERRLALLASRTVNGVLFTDVEGHIEWANEGFTRLTGYGLDEVRGRWVGEFLHGPDTDPEAVASVRRQVRDREACVVELLNYHRSGRPFWVRLELQPRFEAGGAFAGYMGLQTDVTAQKETEAALREREALLEAVADAMQDLLLSEDSAEAIGRAFERLGRATRADRVYLFEAHDEPGTGVALISQRYEWSRNAVAPQIDNPELQNVPFDEVYARWHRVLRDRGIIAAHVADMPADERPLLEAQDIQSLLVVPIHLDGRLWGFIGFDACHEARAWSGAEQATLTAAAGAIGKALSQQRDREALRQSEQKYRTLFEQAGDAILIFEPADETVLEVNERACHLYGFSREELVGRSIKSFSTDVEAGEEKVHEVLSEGLLNNFVTVQRRKDGTPLHLVISASLIEYEGRTAVLSLNRDVTARLEAERALRDSEQKYREVVENMRDVVFRTDAEGRWIYLNPAWTRITGFGIEEVLGTAFTEWIHPDDWARSERLFEQLVAREKAFCRHEVRYRTRDGGYRWLEVYATLQRDEDGAITGVVGMLHDVSERKQAMEALERALERERELGLLKSRFVSMASHELRTPLTAIRGSAELLHRFGERWDAERRQVLFDRILGNTETMNELIEDVLLLGRVETGRLGFAPESLELRAWGEALVQEVREGAGARHAWRLDLPSTPVHAEADTKLLRHILINLLSNAVKYAPEGSPIDVHIDRTDDAVRLVVADEGIGIPEAEVPHLFEPFRRASNVGSRSGTGLGLAIAKRALDLHGGTIEVESVLGAGTTFTVTLPLVLQGTAPQGAAPQATALPA